MSRLREIYVCSACQGRSSQWKGQCPNCGEWNSLEPLQVKTAAARASSPLAAPGGAGGLMRLADACESAGAVFSTGLDAFDRVLGKGLVPGSALLLGGEPGIGKSTLLLQVAGAVAAAGNRVVYLSGEESLAQIRARAQRLGLLHDDLYAIATSQVEDVFALLEGKEPPALLILDSVQTLSSLRADGLPGNVSQVRAVATEVVERCKKSGCAVILVGHVTKDGVLAGPRLLEHMVDTVISLEGDRQQIFRLLRVLKNRFGPNREMLIFQMLEQGMELVEDPATYFLGARDASLSGAAVVMAVDGQRPLAVEVQALVTKSYLAIPRRTGLGFDVNRLHLLLAVLEKRLQMSFAQVDIYAKVGGGMRLMEPGMDLALVAAVLSSYYDLPLPERAVFWGEVDLNGQIRPVAGDSIRRAQARRLGYTPLVCPPAAGPGESGERAGGFSTIKQMRQALFSRQKSGGQ
ncbi:DNA repair protein RadA [Desulfovibrio sp. OttesenSCG-928-A18]|nr:DNA repair protein RadA [Desulfovibrio sp. OttesenSCG-928-A18]